MHLAYSVTSSLFEHLPQCTFSRIFENVISKWTKVAIIKTESTTIAFFSSPSFPLLALSFFSPFLFLRYCDFGASRA